MTSTTVLGMMVQTGVGQAPPQKRDISGEPQTRVPNGT